MLYYPDRVVKGPLGIDGSDAAAGGAKAFEQATLETLEYIAFGSHTHTGTAVVAGILDRGAAQPSLSTTICFHTPVNNAFTWMSYNDSNVVSKPGITMYRLGHGSNARIEWNSGEWPAVPHEEPNLLRGIQRNVMQPGDAAPGTRADEILLHEMVHALMGMSGAASSYGVKDYDTVDDFLAVSITNMYSVELGRPPRADHHGHHLFGSTARDVRNHPVLGGLLLELTALLPEFTGELAKVDSQFNLFADR